MSRVISISILIVISFAILIFIVISIAIFIVIFIAVDICIVVIINLVTNALSSVYSLTHLQKKSTRSKPTKQSKVSLLNHL